ncbi:MAG TPA: hypothetical protein VFN68_16480 [Acidimicrobiales bacterium]|nr:hypothetical protein [Acidimicrobiales bacterium]
MAFRKARRRARPSRVGQPAPPVTGVDPRGGPVSVDPEGRTLYFLTSSCRPCRPVWATLTGDRVAVVTPDPSTEDRAAVAELAPAGVTVVMSSDTWFAYAPGPAPWTATVSAGVVSAEGPAAG